MSPEPLPQSIKHSSTILKMSGGFSSPGEGGSKWCPFAVPGDVSHFPTVSSELVHLPVFFQASSFPHWKIKTFSTWALSRWTTFKWHSPQQHHLPAACPRSCSEPQTAPDKRGAKNCEEAIMHLFSVNPWLAQASHFIFKWLQEGSSSLCFLGNKKTSI